MTTTAPAAPAGVVVVAPTWFEWAVSRPLCRGVRLRHSGVARVPRLPADALVLSVGLCGALRADLAPGTLVIPARVGLIGGPRVALDAAAARALVAAAAQHGLAVVEDDLLTAPTLVTGAERQRWAAEGYAAVDMETGLFAAAGMRVAAARVVLDGPNHELPAALLGDRRWRERAASAMGLLRLAAPAARGAATAARVAAAAAAQLGGG